MNLQGKVCLVTGGTKGIGAATALLLAGHGASVAIVGRNLEDPEAAQTIEQLEATGQPMLVIRGDVADPLVCKNAVEETRQALGEVDVLIHSAGGPVPGSLLEIDPETWLRAFDVHIHPIFYLSREVVPAMKKKKEGAIILIGSVAGIRGLKVNIAYQAVKGAIPQITRGLAYELADDNIRVNAVAPGVIWTDFHKTATEAWRKNNLDNRIPLHKEGRPDQIASVIREMIENDYITGEVYVVDGGLTMRIC